MMPRWQGGERWQSGKITSKKETSGGILFATATTTRPSPMWPCTRAVRRALFTSSMCLASCRWPVRSRCSLCSWRFTTSQRHHHHHHHHPRHKSREAVGGTESLASRGLALAWRMPRLRCRQNKIPSNRCPGRLVPGRFIQRNNTQAPYYATSVDVGLVSMTRKGRGFESHI